MNATQAQIQAQYDQCAQAAKAATNDSMTLKEHCAALAPIGDAFEAWLLANGVDDFEASRLTSNALLGRDFD